MNSSVSENLDEIDSCVPVGRCLHIPQLFVPADPFIELAVSSLGLMLLMLLLSAYCAQQTCSSSHLLVTSSRYSGISARHPTSTNFPPHPPKKNHFNPTGWIVIRTAGSIGSQPAQNNLLYSSLMSK